MHRAKHVKLKWQKILAQGLAGVPERTGPHQLDKLTLFQSEGGKLSPTNRLVPTNIFDIPTPLSCCVQFLPAK